MKSVQGQFGNQLTIRPSRVAYLIGARSSRGMRDAVEEACTRWGGATEPILAVTRRTGLNAWQRQILEILTVEALVNVDLDPDTAALAGTQASLSVTSLQNIDRSGEGRFTCHPSSVVRNEQASIAAGKDDDLWRVAALGVFRPSAFSDHDELEKFPIRLADSDDCAIASQISGTSLIDRTMSQFGEIHTSGQLSDLPSLCVIGTPNALRSCVWFWNLRALSPWKFSPTVRLLLPNRKRGGLERSRSAVHDAFQRRADLSHDLLAKPFIGGMDDAHAILGELGLVEDTSDLKVSRKYPPPVPRQRPFSYRLFGDLRQLVRFERSYGARTSDRTTLYEGETSLTFPSPIEATGFGKVTALVGSEYFGRLPKSALVARHILDHAGWELGALKIRTNLLPEYRLRLRIPSVSEAVSLALKDSTESFSLSDKGRIAGRIPGIPGEKVHVDIALIQCVAELATPRAKALSFELANASKETDIEILEELAATWGGRRGRRYRAAADITRDSKKHLERLTKAGWAERGLESRCEMCLERTFVPLDRTTFDSRCPACSAPGQQYGKGAVPTLHYRLNAMIDRAYDQGVMPHLFADTILRDVDPLSSFLLGVDVTIAGRKSEIDIYGCWKGTIVAGELKTSPSEFSASQLQRDVHLAKALGGTYLLGSTTPVADEQIAMARELCSHLEVVMLVLDPNGIKQQFD